MRYYSLVLSDPATGQVLVPDPVTRRFIPTAPSAAAATYTSLAGNPALGVTIPGALNVEIDIPVVPFATPQGQGYVRIWGVSLAEIAQSADLNRPNPATMLDITVYAGMQRGLPLAKPQQAGIIASGKVYQAFGNWQGVEQSLDLVLFPGTGSPSAPANIQWSWPAGTPLAQALSATLSAAFPGYQQSITISPNLVLPNDETGSYSSLVELAQYVKAISFKVVGGGYAGVDIVLQQGRFIAYDGTGTTNPIQLLFEDMVGQPTWIDAATINLALVMRADLHVGDQIKLPQGLISPFILTPPQVLAPPGTAARNQSAFSGTYQVTEVHHFGNFRQPDANSWVTMINAAALPKAA